jgi:hypothetical protein
MQRMWKLGLLSLEFFLFFQLLRQYMTLCTEQIKKHYEYLLEPVIKGHVLLIEAIKMTDTPANLDAEKLTDLQETLQSFPEPKESIFDIGLFQNGTKKSATLINNFDLSQQLKSQNRWYSFDFKKSLYVKKIRVRSSGFDNYSDMVLSYEDAFTKKTNQAKSRFKEEVGYFEFIVDAFVGGFGIQPEPKYFSSPRIVGIDVFGFDEVTFRRVLGFFEKIEIARNKILEECQEKMELADQALLVKKEVESNIIEIKSEIDVQNQNLESIKELVAAEAATRAEAMRENSALQITQKQLVDSKTALESDIANRKSSQTEMSRQIAESEKKLRTLENDINLFPTEIAGYVTQGSKNINTYLLIGAIPVAIIAVLTWRLIFNAEQLLDFYANNPQINIFEFLFSRLPYVIISISILGICYTFIHRLISEIIGINRRRQDLYKISIIATDISYASASGSIVDGESEYKLRTYIKMEMLKEHLRRHMGEGFTFEKKGGLLAMLSDISTTAITGKTDKDDDE